MLLKDMGLEQKEPTVIFEDNVACEKMTKNNIQHSRTKHIEIKHHFIREAVKNNSLDIQHLATTEMLADILTKALPAPQFLKLRHSILDHT